MTRLFATAGLLVLSAFPALAGPVADFAVEARYEAPGASGEGALLVFFSPSQSGIHVNELPAARLNLDPAQSVLEYKAPPAPRPVPVDPATVKAIDLTKPLRFPVVLGAKAPHGAQHVKGVVTYFYCSDREHWCKRGQADIDVAVTVP